MKRTVINDSYMRSGVKHLKELQVSEVLTEDDIDHLESYLKPVKKILPKLSTNKSLSHNVGLYAGRHPDHVEELSLEGIIEAEDILYKLLDTFKGMKLSIFVDKLYSYSMDKNNKDTVLATYYPLLINQLPTRVFYNLDNAFKALTGEEFTDPEFVQKEAEKIADATFSKFPVATHFLYSKKKAASMFNDRISAFADEEVEKKEQYTQLHNAVFRIVKHRCATAAYNASVIYMSSPEKRIIDDTVLFLITKYYGQGMDNFHPKIREKMCWIKLEGFNLQYADPYDMIRERIMINLIEKGHVPQINEILDKR